jgi:4-hydroxybenzoate polyprenyltransferase
MPMIDAYTTGLDWLAAGEHPRTGLWLFLAITYLNGIVLEIGRKIRAPEDERDGVETYTRAWGLRGAPSVWLAVLVATALAAAVAGRLTGAGIIGVVMIAALLALCVKPGMDFRRAPTVEHARKLDTAAGLWTLGMYLTLAVAPFFDRRIGF